MGSVARGMGRFVVVSSWGWGCLEVWGLDKVGMRFGSVWLIGRVLYGGWGKIKIAHTCCDCCDVGESAGKLCALCGVGCLTGLSSYLQPIMSLCTH